MEKAEEAKEVLLLYTECDFLREVLSPFGVGCRTTYTFEGGIVAPLLLWIHKLTPFRVLQTKRKLTSAAYFDLVSFARLMTIFSHHWKHATS